MPFSLLQTSLESIASEFSRQAAHLGILGLGDASGGAWEADSGSGVGAGSPRMKLHFGDDAAQEGNAEQALSPLEEPERLDMFFPFDPYLLRTSLRYTHGPGWLCRHQDRTTA